MARWLEDLIRHKAHADAALLSAIRENDAAARDEELLKKVHHILLANRFWLSLALGREFSLEAESRRPETIDQIIAQYRQTQADEIEWISRANEADLERPMETPYLPGRTFSVAQGMMQVCLHSHGHRAQCGVMLRGHGAAPPPSDFVAWLKDRPAPAW